MQRRPKLSRTKKVSWFAPELGNRLTPECRKLLEDYSGVPAEEVEKHVWAVRDQAWQSCPYPSIGEFWFLKLGLSRHPHYPALLERFKADPSTLFLDLGTCLGQDIRKLIYDGAPGDNLFGSDINPLFERDGFQLFRDAHLRANHFIAGDVFAQTADDKLFGTRGKWDVISCVMFLHLWDLEKTVRACKQVLSLLSEKKGSMIIGVQTGTDNPREHPLKPPFTKYEGERTVYRHSVETFVKMWERVKEEAGLADLEVWAENTADPSSKSGGSNVFGKDGNVRISFTVTRG